MAQPTTRIPFAGLDGRGDEDTDLPEWYSDKLGLSTTQRDDASTFQAVVQSLPQATTLTPGYYDEERDEWIRVDRKQAVVNPDWTGDALDDTHRDDALWSFRSDSYKPVNPMEMYGPLIAVARRRGATGAFGAIRQYRDGGEVALDLLFPSFTVGEGDQYVMGVQTGYSHYGDQSLWTEVIAFDRESGAEMRHLGDRMSRVHVGEATSETAAYHEQSLDGIEVACDTLAQVMDEARQYEFPIDEMPYSVTGFYEGLKLPQYLCEEATQRLVGDESTRDPERVDAWSIYLSLATAITEEFDGKDGGALRSHNKAANKILFSPPSAESTVINYWQNELAGQETLSADDQQAKATLADRYDSAQEMVATYNDLKQTMKNLVDEATSGGSQ